MQIHIEAMIMGKRGRTSMARIKKKEVGNSTTRL